GSLGVQDRIHWLGRLSKEEMTWCYSECEVFVTTSRAEACPNIVLEAMSQGCCVVSTDQPPMPEFLREGAHFYQRLNFSDLASKLVLTLSQSKEERKALGQLARVRAAEFTWE